MSLDTSLVTSTMGSTAPTQVGGGGAPARRRLRVYVWPAVIVVILLGAGLVSAIGSAVGNGLPLDPDSASPDGARALAQVLRHHGVDVTVVRSAADLGPAIPGDQPVTIAVSDPAALSDRDVQAIVLARSITPVSVVLVQPGQRVLDRLMPGTRLLDYTGRVSEDPSCADPVAVAAGSADGGGGVYAADPVSGDRPWQQCYPVDGGYSVLASPGSGAARDYVLGQASVITNERLDHGGNAALAVGAFGSTGRLVWFAPLPTAVPGERPSLESLLPRWVGWVTLQLFIVAVVCMLWRGRRLGRLATEPLPVVVRSLEATLGRARMYRRARAQARAAQILRDAALTRLRARSGLPRGASPADVAAVLARQTGIPQGDLLAYLAGPPPTDDEGLVRLARMLDRLDNREGNSP